MKKQKNRKVSTKSLIQKASQDFDNFDELTTEANIEIQLEMEIRRLRKEKNLTQKDLANKMNTQQATISKLEKDISHAKLETLVKLANAFDKKLIILFQ